MKCTLLYRVAVFCVCLSLVLCSCTDKHQQGEKSQVQSLNVPAKSPESEVVLPEVKGQDAECKVGAQPSSEAEESSKAQRRQKEVTLKSREPTRVQTFAPEVQQVLAITEAPIEAVVVLIEDETVATVLAIMTPQALSVGEEARYTHMKVQTFKHSATIVQNMHVSFTNSSSIGKRYPRPGWHYAPEKGFVFI